MAPFAFYACQAATLGKEFVDATCHRSCILYICQAGCIPTEDGDEAGLGAMNTPYASLGVMKTEKGLSLRCYDQNTNKEVLKPIAKNKVVWLRLWGDYDKSLLQYSYSLMERLGRISESRCFLLIS